MKKLIIFFLLIIMTKGGAFAMQDIKLPEPTLKGKMTLETAIQKRRSVRSFVDKDLTLSQISQILWAAQGITDKVNGFRSAPSAGALYPITVLIVKKDGFFEYVPDNHSLKQLSVSDLRIGLSGAALDQESVKEAPVDIVIAADFRITESKYGSRSERYVALEAGHIAQNILLEATALGLGGVPIGAFYNDKVKEALSIEKDPLYILPIGYSRAL